MKVRVIIPFADDRSYRKGEVCELPEGKNWLQAGLVVPAPDIEMERAILPEPEKRKSGGKGKGKKKDAQT